MPDNMYRVGIGAEDKEFQSVMSRMEGLVTRVTSMMEGRLRSTETSFARAERAARGLGTALGAYIGWRAIENVGKAALEQERAIGGLSSAYQSVGVYSDDLMGRSISLANEMQRLTNVQDDAVESGMALMVNIGRMSAEQIPAATRAAIGLSEAYGVELEAAFKLVGRAAAGNTATLSRYGITVDTTRSQAEQFNQVLEAGARGFDQAERNARDSMGTYQQLGIQIGELKEAIGGIATTPLILGGVEKFIEGIRDITDYVNNMGITIDLVSVKFQKMFVKASGALSEAMLASGQIPGAQRAGVTSESIQTSVNQQLAQLDKWALNQVNEWEKKQADRMRALGNRPVKIFAEEVERGAGVSEGRGSSRVSTRWEESEFMRLAKEEERVNNDQRRNEEAERKADVDWFNQQVEMTEKKQLAEYEYLDGVREKNRETMEAMRQHQQSMTAWWGDTVMNMVNSAEGGFDNIGRAFDRMLKQMVIRMAVYGLINIFTGGTLRAGIKIGLGLPGRASGGPVSSGQPYLVGERGPELFVPGSNGRIVPNQTWNDDHSTFVINLPAGTPVSGLTARQFSELYKRAKRDGMIPGKS